MTDETIPPLEPVEPAWQHDWNADDQNLLAATLAATSAQRLTWLEEALRLAYATRALKPRRFLSQEEWMGKQGLRADGSERGLRLSRCS